MFVRNFLDIAQDKIRLDSYQVKKKKSSYQRDHAVLVNNDNSQPNVSRSKKIRTLSLEKLLAHLTAAPQDRAIQNMITLA